MIMPVADKTILKVLKGLPCTFFHAVSLDCCSHPKPPGSRIEESRPVGSILNAVRECQRLLVIIEPRGEHLGNGTADLGCTSDTDQRQSSLASAARADILFMVPGPGRLHLRWNQNRNHLGPAGRTVIAAVVTETHLQALRAQLRRHHIRHHLPGLARKHHADLVIRLKVPVIEPLQSEHGRILTFI